MADSLKAADEAGYTRDGANALLYMAGRLYDKDMDRDFRVPMTTLGDDIDR